MSVHRHRHMHTDLQGVLPEEAQAVAALHLP